jgi:hypothetical protein
VQEAGTQHVSLGIPLASSVTDRPPSSRRLVVELLSFDGCPNYRPLETRLRRLLDQSARGADLRQLRVDSDDAAIEQRFLGSPTVRVDGVDVEPDAALRDDYGLSCRLYATAEGLVVTPPDQWITAALKR